MTDEKKILVFYTNNADQDCLFGYPTKYTEKAKNEWVNILKEVDPNIDTYEYDFIPVSELPDKKYKAGIKGTKTTGIWVDDEKYFLKSDVKEQKIAEIKNEVSAELAKSDYKILKYQEGQLSLVEYDNIKTERQTLRDKYNEKEAKILAAETIKEFEELDNGQ
jgi:hypothetical protein